MIWRAVFTLLLLILSPLSIEHPRDGADDVSDEVVMERLIRHDRPIDGAFWHALADAGHAPLRQVGPDAVLVHTTVPVGLDVDPAEWRPHRPGGTPLAGDALRVVLEPRWPDLQGVRSALAALDVTNSPVKASLQRDPLPVVLEATWPGGPIDMITDVPGLLWIEQVAPTSGRNDAAGGTIAGITTPHALARLGLDGDGVRIGVADTGLDRDHACFVDAPMTLGIPGEGHRKVVHLNTSIHGLDALGHANQRHGTHIAGTLACDPIGVGAPTEITSIARGARLVMQDIVNESGWVPPDIEHLLWEDLEYGAMLHSASWGDDTTAYTARSADLDSWGREVPWSLTFVAPGNTNGALLEPANARNVLAVVAGHDSRTGEFTEYAANSRGPVGDVRGVGLIAPGVSIQSARSDGNLSTFNNDSLTDTGTSMATPVATSAAAVLQQAFEQGWIRHRGEDGVAVPLVNLSAGWTSHEGNGSILLSEGFTPSGSMMRAMLASAARDVGAPGPDERTGWGVPDLNQVLDLETALGPGIDPVDPSPHLWIHDAFQIDGDWRATMGNRMAHPSTPLATLLAAPWDGNGARGPFLGTGDRATFVLDRVPNEDLHLHMAFPARPEPWAVEDLQLVVRLPDGRLAVGEDRTSNGSQIIRAPSTDLTALSKTNETIHGVHLDAGLLGNTTTVIVEVRARHVGIGNQTGTLGVDGDRVGFALAVRGAYRDARPPADTDGDGVPDTEDPCPLTSGNDLDADGCPDDLDEDGVIDPVDACPSVSGGELDLNGDGCPDDSDEDGVPDEVDRCLSVGTSGAVDGVGCPLPNRAPTVTLTDASGSLTVSSQTVDLVWYAMDPDGDPLDVLIVWELVLNGTTTGPESLPACGGTDLPSNSNGRCIIDFEALGFPLNRTWVLSVALSARDHNLTSWTDPGTNSTKLNLTFRPTANLSMSLLPVDWGAIGSVDPGESVQLSVEIRNEGFAEAVNATTLWYIDQVPLEYVALDHILPDDVGRATYEMTWPNRSTVDVHVLLIHEDGNVSVRTTLEPPASTDPVTEGIRDGGGVRGEGVLAALLVLFVVGMLVKGMTTLQQGVERLVDGEESDDRA